MNKKRSSGEGLKLISKKIREQMVIRKVLTDTVAYYEYRIYELNKELTQVDEEISKLHLKTVLKQ
jgi:hypothetical protein